MARYVLIFALFIMLAAVTVFAVVGWQTLGDIKISGVGLLALIGGGLLTVLVGGGLMALAFFSSRQGYDERAGHKHHKDNGDTQRD